MSSSTSKVFDEAAAEKKFLNAKNTQESIQSVSSWAMQHKSHHEKIVAVWFSVLKKCNYNALLSVETRVVVSLDLPICTIFKMRCAISKSCMRILQFFDLNLTITLTSTLIIALTLTNPNRNPSQNRTAQFANCTDWQIARNIVTLLRSTL